MKKLLAVFTGAILAVGLAGGFSFALAHGDNSGSGSGSEAVMGEFRLDEDGEFRLEGGEVIKVKSSKHLFKVDVQGVVFTVEVMAGAEFDDDVMLSDLMVGDIVEVRGTFDADRRVIQADRVEVEGADFEDLEDVGDDEAEEDNSGPGNGDN